MTLDRSLLDLAASQHLGVLATTKRDGRPQLSNVNFFFSPDTLQAKVSVIDARAKVANVRRDPRVSMLVSSDDGWSYAVLEGTAELSAVAASHDDETVDELIEVYRSIRGEEHPDWEEYRRAMVDDRRLVLRLSVQHVYGLRQH